MHILGVWTRRLRFFVAYETSMDRAYIIHLVLVQGEHFTHNIFLLCLKKVWMWPTHFIPSIRLGQQVYDMCKEIVHSKF